MHLRIRDIREDNDYTQTEIAKLLHCTQQTYSRYESGEISIDIHSLTILAKFYNTSVDYLLGLTDVIKPYKNTNKKTRIKNIEGIKLFPSIFL